MANRTHGEYMQAEEAMSETLIQSLEYTPEQVALIKRTVAAGASPDEFEMFMYNARASGLDVLRKQIYFVKRQGKGVVQVGIDGLRLIADRTGKYAGSDDIGYDGANERGYPSAARCTVYKMVSGKRCPFTATARWEEYFPGDAQGFQWKRMPFAMLGKCAEALALRKAFPADMSGLYVHEEMDQAGEAQEVSPAREATAPKEPSAPFVTESPVNAGASGGTSDGEGKEAFGYVPSRWPIPKMFSEAMTESQGKMAASKARERMIEGDDRPLIRRMVLEAYALNDGDSKAHQSLWIDWLMSADDEALDRAVTAAEQFVAPLELE
ncbi:MAG: phage recombination protein Bet [Verrucomicrobiaceae bacterium]|nr:MAG: phage recombination protein Bet [Verrucomicrobiaceae bacterium]